MARYRVSNKNIYGFSTRVTTTGLLAGLAFLVTALLAQFIQSSVIVFGIMAPMMIATCDEMKISPSKTLFPLSIVSIATISALPLGGGATRFGTLNGYLQANDYAS